jgi:CubicO group peptidase (beta-lactamase class C family)
MLPAATNEARYPVCGTFADGFEPVARTFARHLFEHQEIGAGFCVYHRGRCVVDLWGGQADLEGGVPWRRDTRAVVFSVTKGLAAMALSLLADRGKLAWDAPVASIWPGFAQGGKEGITLRSLFNHRAGLAALDGRFTMEDCLLPERNGRLVEALERQRPLWEPGTSQGYHAVTFGMYASEVFARLAGEPMGPFLARELFGPLGADVSLGTPAEEDAHVAEIYPPATPVRLVRMLTEAVRGRSNEGRVTRATLARGSIARKAFMNPRPTGRGMLEYNDLPVRRAALAWASATASAHGLARAYLPFASGGVAFGKQYLRPSTIAPIHERQSWSERDAVLCKPLGWSQGFLKDETHVFSPSPESFGHAGMGGALGWCDPVKELSFGYVMNRIDWHVRSPRAVALCAALYGCEPLR